MQNTVKFAKTTLILRIEHTTSVDESIEFLEKHLKDFTSHNLGTRVTSLNKFKGQLQCSYCSDYEEEEDMYFDEETNEILCGRCFHRNQIQ